MDGTGPHGVVERCCEHADHGCVHPSHCTLNAIALAQRLCAAGSPVELRDYSGLSHEDVVMALSVPFRSKGPVLADSVAFLNRHLGKEQD